MKKLIAISLFALTLLQLNARAPQDSLCNYCTTPRPTANDFSFRVEQLAIPAAMITLGAVGCVTNGIIYQAKDNIRLEMSRLRCHSGTERYYRFDDYIQYVPAGLYLTMGFIPSLKKNDFGHRALALATSWASLGIMVNVLKYTVCETRPDGSARNSFPSGHTATVFMGAELMRIEYGWGVGAGAYAIAATVAFMRLYNNKHWINDIVAGAGIGILSAQIGYWLLPYTEKILPKKYRYISSLALTPQSSFPGSMELAIRVGF